METFFTQNDELALRLLTLLALVIAFSISGYYRRRADREGGELPASVGRGLLILLRSIGLIGFLPLFGYLINPAWVEWARFDLPLWIRLLAALFAFAVTPFFLWLFRSIGTNISPSQATRSDHTLVTDGPYRWIRHPLYSGGLLFYTAIILMTAIWWIAVPLIPGFAILMWRTRLEEANLIERFGDEYRNYMARTGRFFPRLRT